MKKKLPVILCSMAIGLLLISGCGKKEKDPTTKKPDNNTTAKPTSSKATTKKTDSPVKTIDVYYMNQKITDSNNTITLTYGDYIDVENEVVVKAVHEDLTENVLAMDDFEIETDLTDEFNAGTYTVNFKYGGKTSITINIVINKKQIDVSELQWDYTNPFTYDGLAHSVALKDEPEGTSVTYSTDGEIGNSQIDAKDGYVTVANISLLDEDNYELINATNMPSITWKINKKVIDSSSIELESSTFTYDGNAKTINVVNLPTGITVELGGTYSATEAGDYEATVTLSSTNPNCILSDNTFTVSWSISKAKIDMSNVEWDYKEGDFVYNGDSYSIDVKGLPTGVTRILSGQKTGAAAGTYEASVTFEYDRDNYILDGLKIQPNISWTIEKAKIDLSNVTWNYSEAFTYEEGTSYSITLLNLPTGASPIYDENVKENAGEYTATVSFDLGTNYVIINDDDFEYSKTWVINKVKKTLEGITFVNDSITYDGLSHQLEISGTLPTEISVIYEGSGTDIGEYNIKAKFTSTNTNYYIDDMDAVLTITKADFVNVTVNGFKGTFNNENHNIVANKSATTVNDQPVTWKFSSDGETWVDEINVKEVSDSGTYYYKVSAPNHNDETGSFEVSITLKETPIITVNNIDSLSKEYDGNEITTPDYSITTDTTGAVQVLYSIDGETWTNAKPKDAGVYTIKITVEETTDYAGNTYTNTFTISKKELTISNVEVDDKVYDGTIYVTISNYGTLNGIIDGENVTLDYENVRAIVENSDTGNSKPVVITGYALSGSDAFNYTLNTTGLNLTIKITEADFQDGTSITAYTGVFDGNEHCIYTQKSAVTVNNQPITWQFSEDGENWIYESDFVFRVTNVNDSKTYYYKITALNHKDKTGTLEVSITKKLIDMTGVAWNYTQAFTYNNTEYSLVVNNVPAGITATLNGVTKATNAGEYSAEVEFTYGNYDSSNYEFENLNIELVKDWVINKKKIDMSGISWNYTSDDQFIYNGNERSIDVINVPAGVTRTLGGDYSATYAGDYTATVSFELNDSTNYEFDKYDPTKESKEWKINKVKVDMSNVKWNYTEAFTYDGEVKSIDVINVPNVPGLFKILGGTYSATNAGDYEATVEFELDDSINYEFVGYNSSIESKEWKINKAKNIVRINVNDKIYDGYDISFDVFVADIDSNWVIECKSKDAPDDDYDEFFSPKDAGEYCIRVRVTSSINYEEVDDVIVEFSIARATVKWLSYPEGQNYFITYYTGEEQTLDLTKLPGFDSNLMEIVDSDELDELTQEDVGTYYFALKLKDTNNYRWEDSYEENTYYEWMISDDFFGTTGIIIDSDNKTFEYLKSLDKVKDDTIIDLTVIDSDKYVVGINSDDPYNLSETANYEVSYFDNEYIDIRVYARESDWYNLCWFKRIYVESKYFSSITVNDKVIKNEETYNLGSSEDSLNIVINDYDEDAKYYLYNGYDYIPIIDGSINISTSKLEYIRICIKDEFDEDYLTLCYVYINQFKPFEKLTISSYNLSYEEMEVIDISSDEIGNYYSYYSNNNKIITGIYISPKSGYENLKYILIDEKTNEVVDFTKVKDYYELRLEIYEDDKLIQQVELEIQNYRFEIDDTNHYTCKGESARYIITDTGEIEFSLVNSDIDDYTFELYGSEGLVKEYENAGIYREKLILTKTIHGVDYVCEQYVDVIVSPYLNDYGSFSFKTGGESRREGENLFDVNLTVDEYNNLSGDWIEANLHEGYDLESYEMYFVDEEDSEHRRLAIIVRIYDTINENEVIIYALISTESDFVGSLEISDNEYYLYKFMSERETQKLDGDVINLDGLIRDDNLEIGFVQSLDYELFKDDEDEPITKGFGNELDYYFYREGTYTLILTNIYGEHREITINVTGNFGNLIETSIGNDVDRKVLIFNSGLYDDEEDNKDNLYPKTDELIIGYYGSASQQYISNGKVDVNISGVLASYLYKDEECTINITGNVVTLDVLGDDTPYVLVYFAMNDEVMTVKLYLTDEPKEKVFLDFGEGQEVGIVYDGYEMIGEDITSFRDEDKVSYGIFLLHSATEFTLTTDKLYDDYSYAVISAPLEFFSPDELPQTLTFAYIESCGYLFRVTDESSLSVTVPLYGPYFYIVNENVTEFSYDSISEIQLSNINLFKFETTNNSYYLEVASDEYGEMPNINTNARDTDGETHLMGLELAESYYFYIGSYEEDNIIPGALENEGTFKVKFESGFGFVAYDYDDESCETPLQVDEDGYITIHTEFVSEYGKNCSMFYVKSNYMDSPIAVCIVFDGFYTEDEIIIKDNAIIRQNPFTGIKYTNIYDDEITIRNYSRADFLEIEFEEDVTVALFNSDGEEIEFEYDDRWLSMYFNEPGTYTLRISLEGYDDRIITINVEGKCLPIIETSIGDEEDRTILVANGDENDTMGIVEGRLEGYYGSSTQQYIDNGKVEINVIGFAIDYLYLDADLNNKIVVTDDKVTLDVIYGVNNVPYIELYMSMNGKTNHVRLYLTDAPDN